MNVKKRTTNKKFKIWLDLDETLLSAKSIEEYDQLKKSNPKLKKLFRFYEMDDEFVIFERPGLQNFLDFIFSNFEVSVWTAGSQEYCLAIVDNIILNPKPKPLGGERKLKHVFWSYHCKESQKLTGKIKKLSLLYSHFKLTDYNKETTFIIDDNTEVHEANNNNVFIIKPFDVENKDAINDRALEQMIYRLNTLKDKEKVLKK